MSNDVLTLSVFI